MNEIIMDTIKDNILILPLLYIIYLIIEYFDRRDNNDDKVFYSLQNYGPLIGALVGIIPQCGFSVIAGMLFISRNITVGTLIAVFIATSDEAIPILLAQPSLYQSMIGIIVMKFVIAVIAGYLIDKLIFKHQKLKYFKDMPDEEIDEEDEVSSESSCPCCYTQYPMYISALLRALKIFAFLFITSFILNTIIANLGQATLQKVLLNNTIFQPILAALVGFIPNCAASVILTELYVAKSLSFASLLSGLICNAGLGLIVLIRYDSKRKQILQIAGLLLLVAVFVGITLQLLNFTI